MKFVDLGSPAHCAHRRIRVGQRQVAALGEHDVEVQVGRHCFVEIKRAVVERHAFWSQVVRTNDGGVTPRSAASEVCLVEHGHICDAVVGSQVVGGSESVYASTDNDDVIRLLERWFAPNTRPTAVANASPKQRCT